MSYVLPLPISDISLWSGVKKSISWFLAKSKNKELSPASQIIGRSPQSLTPQTGYEYLIIETCPHFCSYYFIISHSHSPSDHWRLPQFHFLQQKQLCFAYTSLSLSMHPSPMFKTFSQARIHSKTHFALSYIRILGNLTQQLFDSYISKMLREILSIALDKQLLLSCVL
jgi:hypothetical protein